MSFKLVYDRVLSEIGGTTTKYKVRRESIRTLPHKGSRKKNLIVSKPYASTHLAEARQISIHSEHSWELNLILQKNPILFPRGEWKY